MEISSHRNCGNDTNLLKQSACGSFISHETQFHRCYIQAYVYIRKGLIALCTVDFVV